MPADTRLTWIVHIDRGSIDGEWTPIYVEAWKAHATDAAVRMAALDVLTQYDLSHDDEIARAGGTHRVVLTAGDIEHAYTVEACMTPHYDLFREGE